MANSQSDPIIEKNIVQAFYNEDLAKLESEKKQFKPRANPTKQRNTVNRSGSGG